MLKWKNILLIVALVELAIGLSNAGQNIFFYLSLPVGTILFGVFLIAKALEKELALFDEQTSALEQGLSPREGRHQNLSIPKEVAHHPVPAAANLH